MRLPFPDQHYQWQMDLPSNDNAKPNTDTEAKWREFHQANPHVYDLIELYAFKAIAAGRDHYGIQTILEMVRWHTTVQTQSEDGFKINNNHGSHYARLFHQKNPQFAGFFRTRQRKGE
jgi:hypothetical protein